MVSNMLKKMIIFSSESRRKTIEGIIKDQAAVSGRSESAIIEQSLVAQLLPKNQNARLWIEILYGGETLANVYASTFSYLSAGTLWEAAHNNGKPIVTEFCRNVSLGIYYFSGNENEFPHLIKQLKTILEILSAKETSHDCALLKHYVELLKEDPRSVNAVDICNLIHRQFETLNNTHTYRALFAIACIVNTTLHDTPLARTQYIDALEKVCAEW